jgi:hypothetical protein
MFLLRDLFHWSLSAPLTDIIEDFQDFGKNGLIAYSRSSNPQEFISLVCNLLFGTRRLSEIFFVPMKIMTFCTSRDHPGSISLVCDLILDSRRLLGIFGANRDYFNFDIF